MKSEERRENGKERKRGRRKEEEKGKERKNGDGRGGQKVKKD